MPRHARLDATGALHHVIIRGIARTAIFLGNDDREDFVERISCLLRETNMTCYAWVLMSNHAHILLRTGDVSLSTFMARLLTGYASGFNRRQRPLRVFTKTWSRREASSVSSPLGRLMPRLRISPSDLGSPDKPSV